MTDFYDVCETAAVTMFQNELASRWKDKDKQVTKSNDSFLDRGFDAFILAYPGAGPTQYAGTQALTVQWEILLDVIVRWDQNTAKAWADFKSLRSDVFNLVNLTQTGRTLGWTPSIEGTLLSIAERPRYIPLNRDPNTSIISHIAQICTLTVTQKVDKE
jgi:hypothetical protein